MTIFLRRFSDLQRIHWCWRRRNSAFWVIPKYKLELDKIQATTQPKFRNWLESWVQDIRYSNVRLWKRSFCHVFVIASKLYQLKQYFFIITSNLKMWWEFGESSQKRLRHQLKVLVAYSNDLIIGNTTWKLETSHLGIISSLRQSRDVSRWNHEWELFLIWTYPNALWLCRLT